MLYSCKEIPREVSDFCNKFKLLWKRTCKQLTCCVKHLQCVLFLLLWHLLSTAGYTVITLLFSYEQAWTRSFSGAGSWQCGVEYPGHTTCFLDSRAGAGPDGLWCQQVCCLQQNCVVWLVDVSRVREGVREWRERGDCWDCLASWPTAGIVWHPDHL